MTTGLDYCTCNFITTYGSFSYFCNGKIEYKDASVSGTETDLKKCEGLIELVRKEIMEASAKRDHAKK